jgi:hypothetical protein
VQTAVPTGSSTPVATPSTATATPTSATRF